MERIAENIAKLYDHLEGSKNKRAINKHYRSIDESNRWPFINATEIAIRRARRFQKESGVFLCGLEYCLFLDQEISSIVNDEKNW